MKLSVIMSVYNNEKSINGSIESILNQSFKDFEFLIINDGSKDNSLDIIKYYANLDDRIKVFNNKSNLGLTKSLNFLIKNTKGDYIGRQDADDISFPNRFELQLNFLMNNPRYAFCGTNGLMTLNKKDLIYFFEEKEVKKNLILNNLFIHPSIMIRKEILKKYGSYNEKFQYAQDYELWCRLIYKNNLKAKNLKKKTILWDSSFSRLSKSDIKKFLIHRLNSIIIKIKYKKFCRNKFIVLISIVINLLEIMTLSSLMGYFFKFLDKIKI